MNKILKDRIEYNLKGYVCKRQDVLHYRPETTTQEGLINFCIEQGEIFLNDAFKWHKENNLLNSFDIEKEINFFIDWLKSAYNLQKEKE